MGRQQTDGCAAVNAPLVDVGTVPNARLSESLLRRAAAMNFYRFCELLELIHPDRPGLATRDTPAHEPVRFRPSPSLGFPVSDIAGVEFEDEVHPTATAPPTVRTTFLGLYGVDAVLPYYFLDDIAMRREGSDALAGLLDLFNHRITTLYYRIWRKYRYPVGFRAGATDAVSRSLLGLVGLGIGDVAQRQGIPAARWLALLGLASQRTRPAEGLVGVVRYLVPDAEVTVQEFWPVAHRMAHATRLGDGPIRLETGNLLLGRTLTERNSTVRIVIAPYTADRLLALLPGTQDHHDLLAMLRVYLGLRFDAELVLRVLPALLPACALIRPRRRLGLSLLGRAHQTARPLDIRIGRYSSHTPAH